MKDVFIITNYTDKQGNEKSVWNKVGKGFDCKNGSINMELCFMPGVKFNIQEYKPKEKAAEPAEKTEFDPNDFETVGPDSEQVPF